MITLKVLGEILANESHDDRHCNKCKAYADMAKTIEELWKVNDMLRHALMGKTVTCEACRRKATVE